VSLCAPALIFIGGKSFSLAIAAAAVLLVQVVYLFLERSKGGDEMKYSAYPLQATLIFTSSVVGSLASGFAALVVLLPLIFGCEPLRPGKPGSSADATPKQGEISLVIDGAALMRLTEEDGLSLRVRIFPIIGGVVKDQEGGDQAFPLAANATEVVLSNIKLGRKKFELHVLNRAGEVVGEGEFIKVVNLGAQRVAEPVTIRLRAPDVRRKTTTIRIIPRVELPNQPDQTTYLDVKNTVKTYCTVCHNKETLAAGTFGALDLTEFPFTSGSNHYPDQAAIVRDMIYSMESETEPMPPSAPFVPYPEIEVFKRWLADGLPARPSGADAVGDVLARGELKWQAREENGSFILGRTEQGDLEGVFVDAIVDQSYEFESVIFADDGSETNKSTFTLIINNSGLLEHELAIPYTPPQLTIPVVIEEPTP
jgi:hypothetical protein